ncbi:MAG: hypothetical protein M0036_02550 [Desulfobacteraceae bacterium]|nr:hypothetical protein [Desulfobacteraceae bacterium]
MKRTLSVGMRHFLLTHFNETAPEGAPLIFDSPGSAQRFLSGFLHEWQSMRTLRDLHRDQFNEDLGRLKDLQVIARMASRISSGAILVWELPTPAWMGGKTQRDKDEIEPKPPVIGKKDEKQTFKLAEVVEFIQRGSDGCVAGAAPTSTSGLYPQLTERKEKDGAAFKQYINLGKDIEGVAKKHPEYGRYVELRARVEWASGDKSKSLSGKKVHWSFAIQPQAGGKRPNALNGNQKPGFSSANGSKTLISDTDAKGWTPIIKFYLSQYAGDQFSISAQADVEESGKPSGPKIKVGAYVVWRKFWYQVTHADGKNVSEPGQSVNAYKQLATDMLNAGSVTFAKAGMAQADRTFYPHWMVTSGNDAAEEVVIGGHNRDWFYNKFKKEAHRPVKGHLIICDHQWDPAGESTLQTFPMESRAKEVSLTLNAWNAGILKPALQGNLVVHGKWKAGKGEAFREFFTSIGVALRVTDPIKREGPLTEANIKIEPGRGGLNAVKVELPADCPDPAKYPITIELKLRYGKFYAGESNKNQMLIVYRSADVKEFNQVVSHEFGHGFGQVPRPGSQPAGLSNHPKQYTNEHGGVGSHCSTATTTVADPAYPAGLYRNGTCIMFHQVNPSACTQTFCAECDPYLRLQDIDKI